MVTVIESSEVRRILYLFARLLDYPCIDLTEAVRECEGLVSAANPEAGRLMGEFRSFVEQTAPGRLQEVYTTTFDLDATHHPYVGYHLFGETYKRSAFLVGLKECYQAQGFSAEGAELPDHLTMMLGFLACCEDQEMAGELIEQALLPALEKMIGKDEQAPQHREASAYRGALQALRLLLSPVGAADLESATQGETLTGSETGRLV